MGFSDRRNKTRYNGKRKFRGNQFTARSRKIMMKFNSVLVNEANKSEKFDEESKECYFIDKCAECDSRLASMFKCKHEKEFIPSLSTYFYQMQLA